MNDGATKHEIINNFLDKKTFDEIKNLMQSQGFPWFLCDKVSSNERKGKDNYYFSHQFYDKVNYGEVHGVTQPTSLHFKAILPLLNKLEVKSLIRVKANLYTYVGTQIEHGFHIDKSFPHKGAIFSINSNNGYTLLEDGTKIESVENRILLFDPATKHTSATCTDNARRINININYFICLSFTKSNFILSSRNISCLLFYSFLLCYRRYFKFSFLNSLRPRYSCIYRVNFSNTFK